MKKESLLILLIMVSCSMTRAASVLQPVNLTCEYIADPLGLDTQSPRFSWTFSSSGRDQQQSAYELLVSDNLKDLQQNKGNMWSTGKVGSSNNTLVEYSGKPLRPFMRYYWKVKVYDRNNTVSSWSGTHWFETAMLNPADWKGKWISDGSKNPEKDADYYKDDRMPLFRKQFSADKKIASARLYISGLGYYEAYLNGHKIGDHVLDPGFTTYKKQALYVVYDVTPMVKKGRNVCGIMLGNGWWNPLPMRLFGRFDLRQYQQTGRPCVIGEIHIRYVDGSEEIVVSDETWKTAPGPVIRNNVYLGEKYDARLEQSNWCNVNNDEKAWKNASLVQGPAGILTPQMQPAIKVTKIIRPLSISALRPDTFIADMGQNFAGVVRIKVKGPAGTVIHLRYGEDVYKDGRLNYMTTVCTQLKKGGLSGGPGAPATAWQEDDYILKGEGTEIWSPRFTFHGFRYVEITGWPGKPQIDNIEGLRMNSDLPANGTFSCSNPMFTQLHKTIQWTFLSNVFSIQSDCPGREKMGYGADMVVSSDAFLYNYNMANFYSKSVRDFANEQKPEGGITEIAPFTGIADKGYGGGSGPLGWELAFPFLQKQLYDYYGDKRIIANNYEAVKRQIAFLRSKAMGNLFYWDISDHEALDPKPESFVASSFYYHHARLAADFAGILGKTKDSVKYTQLANSIKKAILQEYFIPHTGRFDNATQSAQIFALWYHFSPEKDSTFDVLLHEFARHHWHLATGIFSTKMMFDVLRESDKNEMAYRIANQKDYPGWGNMIASGATTLWETWKYPGSGPSQNHPMFGSVDEWFYRSLLGINATSPGFKKMVIKPQPAGDLTWAKGSYQSIKGEIISDWKKDGSNFMLHVSIPANTSATVYIPSTEGAAITEGGMPVKGVRYAQGYAVVEIGSGDYSFQSKR